VKVEMSSVTSALVTYTGRVPAAAAGGSAPAEPEVTTKLVARKHTPAKIAILPFMFVDTLILSSHTALVSRGPFC
jgi:hypothetical protein